MMPGSLVHTHAVPLETAPYLVQSARWPSAGAHILAHHDSETVLVYQAYRPSIGRYAIEHGHLGGSEFSLSRMSWIKPNFLWVMYRSGWGSKEGQESILGLRISRRFFDGLLQAAVASTFNPLLYPSREVWAEAVAQSDVRLQWDPDHAPSGARLERRAVHAWFARRNVSRFCQGANTGGHRHEPFCGGATPVCARQ